MWRKQYWGIQWKYFDENSCTKINARHREKLCITTEKSSNSMIDTLHSTCELINSNLQTLELSFGCLIQPGIHEHVKISESEPLHYKRMCFMRYHIYLSSGIKMANNWQYSCPKSDIIIISIGSHVTFVTVGWFKMCSRPLGTGRNCCGEDLGWIIMKHVRWGTIASDNQCQVPNAAP